MAVFPNTQLFYWEVIPKRLKRLLSLLANERAESYSISEYFWQHFRRTYSPNVQEYGTF